MNGMRFFDVATTKQPTQRRDVTLTGPGGMASHTPSRTERLAQLDQCLQRSVGGAPGSQGAAPLQPQS